jgi:hypothetical protein
MFRCYSLIKIYLKYLSLIVTNIKVFICFYYHIFVALEIHRGNYKSSYNISQLNSPPPSFSFILLPPSWSSFSRSHFPFSDMSTQYFHHIHPPAHSKGFSLFSFWSFSSMAQSLTHFKFIFVYGIRIQFHFFAQIYPVFPIPLLLCSLFSKIILGSLLCSTGLSIYFYANVDKQLINKMYNRVQQFNSKKI